MREATALTVVSAAALALVLNARAKARRQVSASPRKSHKKHKQHAQEHPRFFAPRDPSGNLAINLRFIDNFLRWECGRLLLSMGLFPNAQEISESVACLETIGERLRDTVSFRDPDVVAVVIGD